MFTATHILNCVIVAMCMFPDCGPLTGLDENALRDTFRVEFIAPDGSVESGVDGGGLFKAPVVMSVGKSWKIYGKSTVWWFVTRFTFPYVGNN